MEGAPKRRRRKKERKNSRQRSAFGFGKDSVVGVDAHRIPVGSLKKSEGGVGEPTDEHVVLVESGEGKGRRERVKDGEESAGLFWLVRTRDGSLKAVALRGIRRYYCMIEKARGRS